MHYYDAVVPQLIKMLRNVDRWLSAGEELAKKKSFEPDRLLTFRIAPDMYALVEQVQAIADNAKYLAAHLTGSHAPSHPDTEKTVAELHARLHTVIEYLQSFKRTDFDATGERKIAPRWLGGKWLSAEDYLFQAGLPNFYFHCTAAYAILRHVGCELGKQDFMGALPVRD
jgi:hypothetical protein